MYYKSKVITRCSWSPAVILGKYSSDHVYTDSEQKLELSLPSLNFSPNLSFKKSARCTFSKKTNFFFKMTSNCHFGDQTDSYVMIWKLMDSKTTGSILWLSTSTTVGTGERKQVRLFLKFHLVSLNKFFLNYKEIMSM